MQKSLGVDDASPFLPQDAILGIDDVELLLPARGQAGTSPIGSCDSITGNQDLAGKR
jgi:hypothetical protein